MVDPFHADRVQPASYDLTLHPEVLVPVSAPVAVDLRDVDPREYMRAVSLGEDGFDLLPGGCLLGSTAERIVCPGDVAARVEGKSSLGRLFLAVHVTAGWIDPGWGGQITLEVVNFGPWTVKLWAGMRIAQVNFTRMESSSATPYGTKRLGSHYQGQIGPTASAGRRGK